MPDKTPIINVSDYYINQIAAGLKRYFRDNIFGRMFDILSNENVIINSLDNRYAKLAHDSNLNVITTINNSTGDIAHAINTGLIYYENGAFRTHRNFSNKISKSLEKMGAKYRYGAYYIPRSSLPLQIENAVALIAARDSVQLNTILEYLSTLPLILSGLSVREYIEGAVERTFKKLEFDLMKSRKNREIPLIDIGYDTTPDIKIPDIDIKSVDDYWADYAQQKKALDKEIDALKDIRSQQPSFGSDRTQEYTQDIEALKQAKKNLTKGAKDNAPNIPINWDEIQLSKQTQKVAQDYIYNMDYWVSNWETKNIIEMRKKVAQMVAEGARVEAVEEYIKSRWNIAGRKAQFLAENECGIASSVIMATYWQNKGYTHFRWIQSTSREKRKLHEEYYDKIFAFDNPPIIVKETGQRGLPKQTYNCKCSMQPVITKQFFENRRKIQNAKRNIFTKFAFALQSRKQRHNNSWRYRRFGEG